MILYIYVYSRIYVHLNKHATRQQARAEGRDMLASAVRLAATARRLINTIPGLTVLEAPSEGGGMVAGDPLRVTVGTAEVRPQKHFRNL